MRVSDLLLAVVIAGGIVAIAFGAFFLSGGGDDDGSPSGSPEAYSPTSPDEQAIAALARESIEVLPRGEWPSLYGSFTAEYQQRCPPDQFNEAGLVAARDLGAKFALLKFNRLENVTIDGPTASAVLVGAIEGESEFRIQEAFQNVDGVWKIAPTANTEGCAAFQRLPAASGAAR